MKEFLWHLLFGLGGVLFGHLCCLGELAIIAIVAVLYVAFRGGASATPLRPEDDGAGDVRASLN